MPGSIRFRRISTNERAEVYQPWPALLELLGMVMHPLTRAGWRGQLRERFVAILRSAGEGFLNLIFLPYQAIVSADAIVRTLVRRFITHQNLLEWETMAQVEAAADGGTSWAIYFF